MTAPCGDNLPAVLQHVVLFRWREGMTPEAVAAVESGLAALPPAIPQIRSYRFGADARLGAGEWDFAVVAGFDSVDDWAVYRDHPQHQAFIAECVRPWAAERAAVQFETPGT